MINTTNQSLLGHDFPNCLLPSIVNFGIQTCSIFSYLYSLNLRLFSTTDAMPCHKSSPSVSVHQAHYPIVEQGLGIGSILVIQMIELRVRYTELSNER